MIRSVVNQDAAAASRAKRRREPVRPTFTVEIPELDDDHIEAIAELLVRLIDDDGRIIGLDRDHESAADETPASVSSRRSAKQEFSS
jgi:hypothetical protein